MFCGGKKCKYEISTGWKKEDQAVDGLYSHWITEDILGKRLRYIYLKYSEIIMLFL